MNTIIIDDDVLSIAHLKNYCDKIPQINLIHTFTEPKGALKLLEELPVDLLFLDIEMPQMTGLELLEQIPQSPLVIFTTGNPDYAISAFEFDAVDYLQKPISFPRFQKAINKVLEKTTEVKAAVETNKNLYIKEKGKLIRLDIDDILYFENVRDYVCIKTTKHTYTIVSTLKEIVEKLPKSTFLKVHRSYIINLNKIVDIDNTSLVINGKVIPISRVNRPILLDKIRTL